MISDTQIDLEAAAFFAALETLPDPRDNRGKRHNLAFVLGVVSIAILVGNARTSSIHRYIENKIDWLRELSQMLEGKVISRAHLPRLLGLVDWKALNTLIEAHFDMEVKVEEGEWHAVDGKTLRGSIHEEQKQGERVAFAASHSKRETVAQYTFSGPKSSETAAVRTLLKESGLEKGKITLDALHCNPDTLGPIEQAGGIYLTQVKDNQPALKAHCALTHLFSDDEPAGKWHTTDKGHGRLETRAATFFTLDNQHLDSRWDECNVQTLVVMERRTVKLNTCKTSSSISYYVSNQPLEQERPAIQKDLMQAIRGHWGVESDNWIRDVTFQEDKVKTKDGNLAQVLATLRTLTINLLRKDGINNFQAAIETFRDCPHKLEAMLARVGFL